MGNTELQKALVALVNLINAKRRPNQKAPRPGGINRGTTQQPKQESVPQPPQKPRQVRYTSYFLFTVARRVWSVAFLTLPFDLLLFAASGKLPTIPISHLMLPLYAVALIGVPRTYIVEHLLKIKDFRSRYKEAFNKYSWVGIGAIVLGVAGEILLRTGTAAIKSILPVLVGIAVAVRAALALKKAVKEGAQKAARLERDKILWVETINKQVFLIAIVPIVSARIAAFIGCYQTASNELTTVDYLPTFLAGTALLLALMPQREQFMIECRRCGFPTSRALSSIRACPKCDYERFQKISTERDEELPRIVR